MVLKPKQRQLLEALMTARTKQEAIKGVGISQSTAYRTSQKVMRLYYEKPDSDY